MLSLFWLFWQTFGGLAVVGVAGLLLVALDYAWKKIQALVWPVPAIEAAGAVMKNCENEFEFENWESRESGEEKSPNGQPAASMTRARVSDKEFKLV